VKLNEFLGYIGLGLNALFTQRSWDKRWVDHTPYYALMIDVLAPMFPGARFVHILRDGRSVVHSMLHVKATVAEDEREQMSAGDFLPPWSHDFREACRTWRDSVEAAISACERYPDRCITVRQEHLTNAPEDEFRAIFGFLDAAYESRPAEYWRSNRINSSFGRTAGRDLEDREGERAWAQWSSEQQEMFIVEAGDLLLKLGFATDEHLIVESKA